MTVLGNEALNTRQGKVELFQKFVTLGPVVIVRLVSFLLRQSRPVFFTQSHSCFGVRQWVRRHEALARRPRPELRKHCRSDVPWTAQVPHRLAELLDPGVNFRALGARQQQSRSEGSVRIHPSNDFQRVCKSHFPWILDDRSYLLANETYGGLGVILCNPNHAVWSFLQAKCHPASQRVVRMVIAEESRSTVWYVLGPSHDKSWSIARKNRLTRKQE
mmetsp:Transcript_58339/g.94378  ORF Transcript_58339/g.94378 Transcript_58339/m.94378 type:complete len:217 (+) Transcript_58339:232-882(+)